MYIDQDGGIRSNCSSTCKCTRTERCYTRGEYDSKLNVLEREIIVSRQNLEIKKLKLECQVLKTEVEKQTTERRALKVEMKRMSQQVTELEESIKSISDILGFELKEKDLFV